ncbi:MAG: glycosyltransferase family 4 protein [Anaerolineaceae bacterium]|jgi:glycosyltransferase involved in cell wall biosynthesis
MRLGFHYHIPALATEDGIYTQGMLGRFIDSLADNCDSVVCFQHSPMAGETAWMDYKLISEHVSLVDLGPHVSVPRRMLRFHRVKSTIQEAGKNIDCMFIRGPTPWLANLSAALKDKPQAFLIVGDYTTNIDPLPQPAWRKELIRWWSLWNKRQQMQCLKHHLTFVNSRRLFEEFRPTLPHLLETRTTTLSKADFYIREDTCQTSPVTLLYTGRMDRAKGLLDIVEALALLVQDGFDVKFDLVGWAASKRDETIPEIFSLAQSKGIAERITYHGYKPVGRELFAHYRASDIYVIASRGSEGFPRTIWEAMAHSLPVIATRAGSIPDYVGHCAMLVDAARPLQIKEAVIDILRSPARRRQMIKTGLELAKETTLEAQTQKMVREIDHWAGVHAPQLR